MKKGTSSTSILWTAVQLVTLLNFFAIYKILSVKLSLSEYGTYSQVMMVMQVSGAVTLLGLSDAVNFFQNRADIPEERKKKYTGSIFLIEISVGLLFAVLLCLFQWPIARGFRNPVLAQKHYIMLACLIPMLDNLLMIYQMVYVSRKDTHVAAVIGFFLSVFKTGAVVLAMVIFNSLSAVFISYVVIMIGSLLCYHLLFRKRHEPVHLSADPEVMRMVLGYCIPMGVYQMTNMLTIECDKLVVSALAGSEMLAIYANCSRILPYNILTTAFGTILIPTITNFVSEKKYGQSVNLLKLYMKIGYMSVWILTAVTMVHAGQVIAILYDDKYLVGQTIFQIYILNSMVQFASMHLVLLADGNTKFLMRTSAMTLVLGFVLNVVMYYLVGDLGPAVATVMTTLVYTLLVLRKTVKILGTSFGKIFEPRHMLLYLLQLAGTGLLFFWIKNLILGTGLNFVVTTLLTGGAYVLTNLLIRKKEIFGLFHEIDAISQ